MGGLPWVTVPLALGPRHVGHWLAAGLAACRLGVGQNRIRPVIMKGKIRMDAGQEGTEPQIREQFFYEQVKRIEPTTRLFPPNLIGIRILPPDESQCFSSEFGRTVGLW